MQQDVEILRWSGIWRNGGEVRVGVRLVDGRDALLVAYAAQGGTEMKVHYSLIIQGADHEADFIIPTELEQRVEGKLFGDKGPGTCTLKDLKLF